MFEVAAGAQSEGVQADGFAVAQLNQGVAGFDGAIAPTTGEFSVQAA
jgi:hypothetical protein